MRKVQHRYRMYAKTHGRVPRAMLAHDRKRWPGGCMCGFILWSREQVSAFAKEHGLREFTQVQLRYGSKRAHEMYDTWLSERATGQ